MSPLGRGRGGGAGDLVVEYVAAGADLALVRVAGASAPPTELIVFAGGQVETFEALPAAPGDDRIGFPVALDLVEAADAEFRLVVDGAEMAIARPREARPAAPPAHPAIAEA